MSYNNAKPGFSRNTRRSNDSYQSQDSQPKTYSSSYTPKANHSNRSSFSSGPRIETDDSQYSSSRSSSNQEYREPRRGSFGGGNSSFRSNSGGGSFRSSGSSFGRRSGGGGGSRFRSNRVSIDFGKYIKKAKPVVIQEDVVTESFADLNLHPSLLANLSNLGITHPTPIQLKTFAAVLGGSDVIGIAATGTGKTAAFLLPIIHRMLSTNTNEQTLLIVPTRELASQIEVEFKKFAARTNFFSVCLAGGMSIGNQIFKLKKSNHFIIGTPGRLVDLVNRGFLNLSKVNNLVLDEVDRMLDMGFTEDLNYLLEQIPEQRQSLFFSATLEKSVERLMNGYLRDPVRITISSNNPSANVDQDVVKLRSPQDKLETLHNLLEDESFTRVLVFGETKMGVENIFEQLTARGHKVDSIHGDKSQFNRQRALDNFKNGRVRVLVATDVAARGIDVQNVSHVINYDEPQNYQDYIHRIGRTGRGNQSGKALTFVIERY